MEPHLGEIGKELVLVEYRREQGGWILRLYVDNLGESGILLDELAEISRMIGPILDVEEVIAGPYRLEVSSPGLDRPLGKIEDCERFAGRRAVVTTEEKLNGRRKFSGTIEGREGDVLLLKENNAVYRIPWNMVRKARLNYKMGAEQDGE